MSGDPEDPISFETAVGELQTRLALNAGLNCHARHLADLAEEQGNLDFRQLETRCDDLRDEALKRLEGLIIVGVIRAWVAGSDDEWKRPTPTALRKWQYRDADAPSLSVDRAKVHDTFAARYPDEFGRFGQVKPAAVLATSPRPAQQDLRQWAIDLSKGAAAEGRAVDWRRIGQPALRAAFPGVKFKSDEALMIAKEIGLARSYFSDKPLKNGDV